MVFFLNKCGKVYACWKIHIVPICCIWVCILHCPGCFFVPFCAFVCSRMTCTTLHEVIKFVMTHSGIIPCLNIETLDHTDHNFNSCWGTGVHSGVVFCLIASHYIVKTVKIIGAFVYVMLKKNQIKLLYFVYKAIIFPVVLYGWETWSFTWKEGMWLSVWEKNAEGNIWT